MGLETAFCDYFDEMQQKVDSILDNFTQSIGDMCTTSDDDPMWRCIAYA